MVPCAASNLNGVVVVRRPGVAILAHVSIVRVLWMETRCTIVEGGV